MLISCQVYKNLLVGDWPVLCGREQVFQGLPRTSQHIARHADHQWQKILFKDPEVLLAAELCLWPWRLQEQAHGASARAPSQWEAQSGHWQRPHQLDNVELDSSNKAEAARLVEASSKLASLAFLEGTAIPPRCSQNFFGDEREIGPRETSRKNKISFYRTSTYVVGNMPSTGVLRNESKQIILLIAWSECRRPSRYVPYKCTYVPYDSTFGASDQGQTLDVWQGEDSQIHHLIWQICRFTISFVKKKVNRKRYCQIRFSTTILDHTDKK